MTDHLPHVALVSGPVPPVWRWRDQWPGHVDPARQPRLPEARAPQPPAAPADTDRTLAVARVWAQTIVETLNGRRSLLQLDGWFDAAQLRTLFRAAPGCRSAGGARLIGLRAQSPLDGVIEASLTLSVPPRVRAAAFSLVWHAGRWHCSCLTVG
jgi:hypothetical protein